MRLICSLALGPLAGTAAGMPASVLARPMIHQSEKSK